MQKILYANFINKILIQFYKVLKMNLVTKKKKLNLQRYKVCKNFIRLRLDYFFAIWTKLTIDSNKMHLMYKKILH